ncbi:ARM repeat-containing protein [Meredithblackwellia eburnea MCA 4105]
MAPPIDPTQSLLRWGIENSAPGSLIPLHEDIKAGRRPDLNTDVLKAMMGTTDADRMRECVMVIEGKWVDRDGNGVQNKDVTRDDKLRAWDDLEMLVEDLDNANDLRSLGLWKPIASHLTDDDEEVVLRACWVCGTAVQNNPKSLESFLQTDPLPTIIPLLTSTTVSAGVRNKAMYCLSSTLKHCEPAVARFSSLDGWTSLNKSLQDPSNTLRSKTAFLLSQLVSQSETPATLIASLRTSSIISTLISSLSPNSSQPTGPNGDETSINPDYRDKTLRALVGVVQRGEGKGLEAAEKTELQSVVRGLEEDSDWSVEDLGLAEDEWTEFKKALSA